MKRVLLPLLLLAALAPRAAACPTNELLVNGSTILTSAAQFDSVVTWGDVVVARAGYDLVAAWLAMAHPGTLSHSIVLARDAFDVTGVAPGTPVPVRVEFAVDGALSTEGCGGTGCYGHVGFGIHTAAATLDTTITAHSFAANVWPFQAVIGLPVTLVAGQPMAIEFRLDGWRDPGASYTSQALGTYRFLGLPEGAGITSCQGFVGPATPARAASWGRVKAAYR